MVDVLRAYPAKVPKTRKRLANFVKALLGHDATSDDAANKVIDRLKNASHVKIDGNDKVEYHVK